MVDKAVRRSGSVASGIRRLQDRPVPTTATEATRGSKRRAADDLESQPYRKIVALDTERPATPRNDEYDDSVFDGLTETDFKKLENQANHVRRLQDHRVPTTATEAARGSKRRAADDLESQPYRKIVALDTERPATPRNDEYDDSVFDGLTETDFEKLENQATQLWFEDDSKLYLLKDSRRVGDADGWMQESYDRPPHSANVLNISRGGVLKLTPAGKDQLKDVQIMVWNGDSAYRLYQTREIKGQSLKKFYQEKFPQGGLSTSRAVGNDFQPNVYLRGHQNEFRSIENYNQRYGSVAIPDAAQARFAAVTGPDLHPGGQSREDAAAASNLYINRPRNQIRLR